jgi:hypothetical protein
MEQYATKVCAPYCNNATVDILHQVAMGFVDQVCKKLETQDPDYIKKHIDAAMQKAVEDPKFTESIVKKINKVSKSVKKQDFCKKKCNSSDKKKDKEEELATEDKEGESATEGKEGESANEDNKNQISGGKNKTRRKKLKKNNKKYKTQNRKYKKMNKKYTKNLHKSNITRGGNWREKLSKGFENTRKGFQNLIPENTRNRLQNLIPQNIGKTFENAGNRFQNSISDASSKIRNSMFKNSSPLPEQYNSQSSTTIPNVPQSYEQQPQYVNASPVYEESYQQQPQPVYAASPVDPRYQYQSQNASLQQPGFNQSQGNVYTMEGSPQNYTNNTPYNFRQQSNSGQSEKSYNPYSNKNSGKMSSYLKNGQSYANQMGHGILKSLSNTASNMFGSQQTMDRFIGTAKDHFPDILRRSMLNTDTIIRKDILKSIKKVIESNEDEIKKVIIDKTNKIIDNEFDKSIVQKE